METICSFDISKLVELFTKMDFEPLPLNYSLAQIKSPVQKLPHQTPEVWMKQKNWRYCSM